MKQSLLFTFLLTSFFSLAQAPITQFANSTVQNYAIVESSTAIDESLTGANLTWNFTNLSQVGTNTDTNAAPTSGETTTYPGTTEVLTITSNTMPPVASKLFISNQGGLVSLTGAEQGGQLTLNISDNATLGTFPLNYNYVNNDAVSGDFDASVNGTDANGTFTGTFETEVDAYGTLNLNDFGLGAYNGSVTRLKTELNIDLVVLGFINIGDVEQTNYYYYDNTDGSLVFRSSTNVIDIDAFGNVFMETISVYEAQDRSTLNLSSNTLDASDIRLFPNPTRDILHIRSTNRNEIKSVSVLDLNGRVIFKREHQIETFNVSQLQAGWYIMSFETTNGIVNKRFVKN